MKFALILCLALAVCVIAEETCTKEKIHAATCPEKVLPVCEKGVDSRSTATIANGCCRQCRPPPPDGTICTEEAKKACVASLPTLELCKEGEDPTFVKEKCCSSCRLDNKQPACSDAQRIAAKEGYAALEVCKEGQLAGLNKETCKFDCRVEHEKITDFKKKLDEQATDAARKEEYAKLCKEKFHACVKEAPVCSTDKPFEAAREEAKEVGNCCVACVKPWNRCETKDEFRQCAKAARRCNMADGEKPAEQDGLCCPTCKRTRPEKCAKECGEKERCAWRRIAGEDKFEAKCVRHRKLRLVLKEIRAGDKKLRDFTNDELADEVKRIIEKHCDTTVSGKECDYQAARDAIVSLRAERVAEKDEAEKKENADANKTVVDVEFPAKEEEKVKRAESEDETEALLKAALESSVATDGLDVEVSAIVEEENGVASLAASASMLVVVVLAMVF